MRGVRRDSEREVFLEALAIGMGGGNPSDTILHQESRGQQSFVNSTTLPVKITYGTKEDFERMGITFDDSVADDLFVPVTLPEGWRKEASDHAMWSYLLDDKGRRRASIFYKAAFYDRDAHMSPNTRFTASYQAVGGWENYKGRDEGANEYEAFVKDGETVVWRSEPQREDRDARIFASEVCTRLAVAWLDEHYPDWRDIHAYWD